MTVATPTAERRRAPRRQPTLGTFLCLEPAGDGRDKRLGLVWNISATGISLLFNEPVRPGTTLRGELATELGAVHAVVLRVVHASRLQTGDFILGCQFDRPLSADEMRPFIADMPA
jgi:hypothetical protein